MQARANLAAQLVVDNPTAAPLEVLGTDLRPFLRISRAGVFGNLGSPDFYATATPNGGAAHDAGPERFVRIGRGSSWGWYDHRLHPAVVAAPRNPRSRSRLATFAVPLRYGGVATTVHGHLEFRPLLGQFEDDVTTTPPGMTAAVLQGRLPGLFVSLSAPLTVLGRDGEPFLRSDGRVLSVNTSSRTYVEDQQARGVEAGPPRVIPTWKHVAGSSYTWLDERLRYPSAAPPDDALRRSSPSTVGSWQIPVRAAGAAAALSGVMRWVPSPDARPAAGARGPMWLVLPGAVLILGAAALVVRRRVRSAG